MRAYMEAAKEVRRMEHSASWYHSHSGYFCWLPGIDVSTQMLNHTYQEPFVAIVPARTVSAGKVCLGAFRTYPNSYTATQGKLFRILVDFGLVCKLEQSKNFSGIDVNEKRSENNPRLHVIAAVLPLSLYMI
ncbi:COP9 signalosome complex subunit 5-like isoform X2 [Drosophila willistoni]|uniref:COP9 signalosome complex subunit 5-like isoform X2 n=1 Tax=Drosophila willistoni TaxID=7260 RepID=UPI001F0757BE|nr:COP9 signalosome complex subunit 5-like isoform X2 [Drosophila willistoni]